MQEPTQL